MLESTQNQVGDPLARCSKTHKIQQGEDVNKMLENIENQGGAR